MTLFVVGTPIGVLAGVYLAEYGGKGWLASTTRFINDILLSAPSIIIGLFIYGAVVVPMGGFSALAGCLALAVTCLFVVPGLVGRFGDAASEDMLDLTEDLSALPETQTLQPIGGGS